MRRRWLKSLRHPHGGSRVVSWPKLWVRLLILCTNACKTLMDFATHLAVKYIESCLPAEPCTQGMLVILRDFTSCHLKERCRHCKRAGRRSCGLPPAVCVCV